MQIYACIKHVPDTAATIKISGRAGFDGSVKFVANPYDEYAVEEAVRIVEKVGGEVVAVTLGSEAAAATLRGALAMGARRGILIRADAQFVDSALTAHALARAISRDGRPDLILTGKQSVDGEGMQVHYRLAAALNMPAAVEVTAIALGAGTATVEREIGGGRREVLEIATPCVLGATKGLNEPRYPQLRAILNAKKKEIRQVDLGDLGLALQNPTLEMLALEAMPERGAARMMTGTVEQMVEALVACLEEEKVI
jgi:electron transfer flavoprotein beta subunit